LTTLQAARVRRVRLELDKSELCAIMLVIDHGVARSKRSELCARDLARARRVLAHALSRAASGKVRRR
jgi:hypothetical protein